MACSIAPSRCNTSSREPPRSAGGSCAISDSGRSKSKSETFIVLVRLEPDSTDDRGRRSRVLTEVGSAARGEQRLPEVAYLRDALADVVETEILQADAAPDLTPLERRRHARNRSWAH